MKRWCSYRFGLAVMLAVIVSLVCTRGGAAQGKVSFRDLCDAAFAEGKGGDIAKLIGYDSAAKQVVALQYKVLLYETSGDKVVEKVVDPKSRPPFKVGDRIRLTVEPLTKSYIYIFHIGASKKQVFLLPRKGNQPQLVEARRQVSLPEDGYFEFVAPPGDEKLMVVAAQKPVADLNALASILSKMNDPKAVLSAAEEEIKKTLNATVEANLKSVQERQIEKRDKVAMFRGIGDEDQCKALIADVKARAPTSTTLELPGQKPDQGTLAVYIGTGDDKQGAPPSLLVTIPLRSTAGTSKP